MFYLISVDLYQSKIVQAIFNKFFTNGTSGKMSQIIKDISGKFEIVLASSSPRRFEIVHEIMGFPDITVMKPSFEEDLNKALYVGKPVDYVIDTSKGKADSILEELKIMSVRDSRPKIVICADTVVIDAEGNIHEKPKVEDTQMNNLKAFCKSSRPVRVVTAVNIIKWANPLNYAISRFHEETEVYFDNDLPSEIINDYVQSHNALEVAGGFQIQTFGGSMIERINGDYYNVVGLPLNKTLKAIFRFAKEPVRS